MFYRINWTAASKLIELESKAGSAPAAHGVGTSVSIGTFEHVDDDDTLSGMQEMAHNHVLYHHVQEALYKVGVQNMQDLVIMSDRARSLSIGVGNIAIETGADSAALVVVMTPVNAPNGVVYTSDDEAVATVSPKGIITGVSEGTAAITATLISDENITATRNAVVTDGV